MKEVGMEYTDEDARRLEKLERFRSTIERAQQKLQEAESHWLHHQVIPNFYIHRLHPVYHEVLRAPFIEDTGHHVKLGRETGAQRRHPPHLKDRSYHDIEQQKQPASAHQMELDVKYSHLDQKWQMWPASAKHRPSHHNKSIHPPSHHKHVEKQLPHHIHKDLLHPEYPDQQQNPQFMQKSPVHWSQGFSSSSSNLSNLPLVKRTAEGSAISAPGDDATSHAMTPSTSGSHTHPGLRKRHSPAPSRHELLQQKRRKAREAMDAICQTVFFDDAYSTIRDFLELINYCKPSRTASTPFSSDRLSLSSSCTSAASSSNVDFVRNHPFFNCT